MTRHEAEFILELYQAHSRNMRALMVRNFGNPTLAEDLVAAAFVTAMEKVEQLMAHPDPEGWLFRTVLFKGRHEQRRLEREACSVPLEDALPPAPVDDRGLSELLPAALSQRDRQLLILRYEQGRSAAEIARLMGLTQAAAQKSISRAVARCSPEDVLMPDILVFDSPTQEQLDGAASYLEQVEARVDNLVELAVTYRDTGEGRTVEETRALLEAIRAEADAIQVLSCPLPCLENGVSRPIGLYAKDISGNLVDRVCLPWLEVNPDASALEPEGFARRMTAQLYEFFHLLDKGWAILESIQPAPAE